MNKFLIPLCLVAFASPNAGAALPECSAFICVSPLGTGGAAKETTNRFYTGLVWELGGSQGMRPDVVLGISSLTVENINSVSGSDANLRFKLKDSDFSVDSARLAYVGGKPSALANVGLGYSFTHASALATAGVQASYLRLSTDYLVTPKKFQFFGEINTLKKPEELGNGELSCPAGALMDVSQFSANNGGMTVPSSASVNGKTCASPFAV